MPLQETTIVDWREQMALQALDSRYTVTEVAAAHGVSRPTVRFWRDRYRCEGRSGLEDRSHAAATCPHRTPVAIEELIVEERRRWGWGSKKILQRLEEAYPELSLPKRSTIDAILARHDLIGRRPRPKRRVPAPFAHRYEAREPGELMTIDFKGQFRLQNGLWCYPLTIVDKVSRYLLACEALRSTQFAPMWPVLTRVFREHGLPRALQSDNGAPFGPTSGRYSSLSVRLMMLDIQPIFSRPGCPGDNGSHERMHRDLKAETTRPPSMTLRSQQERFNIFRTTYNEERPHEGIQMQRPARLYKPSPRPFPRRMPKPEYPGWFETRKVSIRGQINWHHTPIQFSEAFAGQTIAFEPIDDGLWNVYFFRITVGRFDERTMEIY